MACIVFTLATPSFFHNLIACTLGPLLSWLLALIPWIFPRLWESWWCRQWKSVMCSRWVCNSPKESFWPWQYPLLKVPPRVIGFNHLGKIFLVTILNMQKRSSYIGESITLNYNLWQLLTLFFLVFLPLSQSLPLYICRSIKPKFFKKKTSFNPAQKCCKAHEKHKQQPRPLLDYLHSNKVSSEGYVLLDIHGKFYYLISFSALPETFDMFWALRVLLNNTPCQASCVFVCIHVCV